jgi:hypothetical protein
MCGSGKRSMAEFADGFDCMRITIGKPALAAATRMPGVFPPPAYGAGGGLFGAILAE